MYVEIKYVFNLQLRHNLTLSTQKNTKTSCSPHSMYMKLHMQHEDYNVRT